MDSTQQNLHIQRRMMVSSVLFPPTVSLSCFLKGRRLGGRDEEGTHPPNTQGPCRLCWCDQMVGAGIQATHCQLVRQTVMDMLAQVGLYLKEEDMTFCPFCLTQLQNLVDLKKEMDLLGERLATMMIGLHTLLSTTRVAEVLFQEEDDAPSMQPTTLGPIAGVSAVPSNTIDALPLHLPSSKQHLAPEKSRSFSDQQHQGVPSIPDGKPFQCTVCPRRFTEKERLRAHSFTHRIHDSLKGRRWPCPHCHKVFTYECRLKQHAWTHTGVKPYACRLCPSRFTRKVTLAQHVRRTHLPNPEKPFGCQFCSSRFTQKNYLKRHVQGHVPPSVRKRAFTCPLAGRCQIKQDSVANVDQSISPPPNLVVRDDPSQPESVHIDLSGNCAMTDADLCPNEILLSGNNKRKGATPKDNNNVPNESIYRFVCSQCNKGFQTRRHLTYHSKTHGSAASKPFTCHICSLPFSNKYHLKRHIVTHRPEEERPLACPQLNCPRRFNTKYNLDVHINSHLPFDERPYACHLCPRRFAQNDQLKTHYNRHNPLEPLSTQDVEKTPDVLNPSVNDGIVEVGSPCSKETFVRGNNSAGKRAHVNTRPFGRQVCSWQFNRKERLTDHVATHIPEEVRRFSCPQCPRRFYRKFNLERHVSSHLPVRERLYACHICPRRFSGKFELTIHINGHLPPNEQPFPCLNCPLRFPSKAKLRSHIRTHLQHNDGIASTGRAGQPSSILVSSMALDLDVDAVPIIIDEKVDLEDIDEYNQSS